MILTPNIASKLYKSARLIPNYGTTNKKIYEMDGLVYFEVREAVNEPLVVVTDLQKLLFSMLFLLLKVIPKRPL